MITFPLLTLTLASVAAAYVVLPATYESKASVVLLSSQIASKEVGGNPYLAFDSSLSVTADVVARRMMDDDSVKAFQAHGYKADYKIALSPESDRPILEVDVTGHNRSDVQATLDAVVNQIAPTLEEIQARAPLNSRIRLNGVSKTTAPKKTISGKLRLLIMGLACGLIVTVAVPLFADSAMARRRPAALAARSPQPRPPAAGENTPPFARKAWPEPGEERNPWEPYLAAEPRRGTSDVRHAPSDAHNGSNDPRHGAYDPRHGAAAPDPRTP
jgi:hypothetical protein